MTNQKVGAAGINIKCKSQIIKAYDGLWEKLILEFIVFTNTVYLHVGVVSVSRKQYSINVSTMTEQNTELYVEMIQVFITNVSISIVFFIF